MSSKIIDGIVKDLKSIPKKAGGSFKGDPKKLILMSLPYMFAGYFADKASYVYRMASGNDMSSKMASVIAGLDKMFADPLPSFNSIDLIIGVAGGAVLRFIVYNKSKNAKKYRHGREYGSARWGTAKDIEPYMDPDFQNNIILTATERLMMSGRPSSPKYARNKNILVIGGSGSGKTRFFVKPNIMQLHSSFCVTDPKGLVC